MQVLQGVPTSSLRALSLTSRIYPVYSVCRLFFFLLFSLVFFCIKYYCKLHDRKRVWPQNGGQAQGNVRVARQFFFSFRILQAQLRAGNVTKKQTFLLFTHTHTRAHSHTQSNKVGLCYLKLAAPIQGHRGGN